MQHLDAAPTPDDDSLAELTAGLAEGARQLDLAESWPAEQLALCAAHGVFRWFLPLAWGGYDWSDAWVTRGYLRLAASCLTTTFIITQRTSACRWLVHAENPRASETWLPGLADGSKFATVAISHLTTSRRHLGAAVLRATERDGGFVLEGYSAWVTGAAHADVIVTGAALDDGRQVLLAVPTTAPGLEVVPPAPLVSLSASHTGEVRFHNVFASRECLLAGPVENVLSAQRIGAGGLQTSTLAIGLAQAAIAFLAREAERRTDLIPPLVGLRQDHEQLEVDLLAMSEGSVVCSNEQLRTRANSLVLRATQAALAAAKGSGYVRGHPAGRWCREALFFLVWSCPQPVTAAVLCELAGLGD